MGSSAAGQTASTHKVSTWSSRSERTRFEVVVSHADGSSTWDARGLRVPSCGGGASEASEAAPPPAISVPLGCGRLRSR